MDRRKSQTLDWWPLKKTWIDLFGLITRFQTAKQTFELKKAENALEYSKKSNRQLLGRVREMGKVVKGFWI